MASAVDSRLAYARLSAVATASRLPTATRGSNNSYTTSWDTTAPENAFLTDQHTQDRYLTENWYPSLFERSDADAWIENGNRDLRARIAQKLSDILDA